MSETKIKFSNRIKATLALSALALLSACGAAKEGEFKGTLSMHQSSGSFQSDVKIQIQEAYAQTSQQGEDGTDQRRVIGYLQTESGIEGRLEGDWYNDRLENVQFYLTSKTDSETPLDCQETYVGSFYFQYEAGLMQGQAVPLTNSLNAERCENAYFSIQTFRK